MKLSTFSHRAKWIRIQRLPGLPIMVGLVLLTAIAAKAQTSSFIYQGRLNDGGTGATGNYDLQFALWDSVSGGTQIGSTVTIKTVPVSNGVFTVSVDFGADSFTGASRFLEIGARPAGAASFTTLSPRQQINSTPYAIRTLNATAADGLSSTCVNCVQDSQINAVAGTKVVGAVANANAANSATNATNATTANGLSSACVNCVQDSQINAVGGSKIVGTIPVAAVPSGSGNYVQNSTAQQAGSSFNISGDGVVGGTLKASQYNVADNRVLSVSGITTSTLTNTFSGVGTGANNTPVTVQPGVDKGVDNSFFGFNAGNKNSTGSQNSFFGSKTGNANTTGAANSFFGFQTGFLNTGDLNSFFGFSVGTDNQGSWNSFYGAGAGGDNVAGSSNSFFGIDAGLSNVQGNFNTVLGSGADLLAGNLTNATAIGANAAVSQSNSLVLGSINGINYAQADTRVGIGTTAPLFRLDVMEPGGLGLRVQTNTGSGTLAYFGPKGIFRIDGTAGDRLLVEESGSVGIGGHGTDFRLTVNNPGLRGLRVGTLTPGGIVASFGGNGDFQIDSSTTLAGRLVIQEGGNVGIGTPGPNTRLDVAGNVFVRGSGTLANNPGAADLQIGYGLAPFGTPGSVSRLALQPYGHTGGPWKFVARDDAAKAYLDWVYGSATTGITQDGSGNVGIGTPAPDMRLSVNGNADKPGGGSWAIFSDERLKNIKGRFTPGLNAVMQLHPLRYEYKPDNALGIKSEGEHIGFSAQQVQSVIPEAVTRNDKGYLLVNNDPIMWTMLNAIKEQQVQMQNQQQEIQQLRREVQRLRSVTNHPRVRTRRA